MKKILIFGGSGLLGVNFSYLLKKSYNVISVFNNNIIEIDGVNCIKYNIILDNSVEKLVHEFDPEIIINCAGLANVEKCEIDKINANKLNSLFPEKLALISKKYNIKLVHISTDHLFDGKKPYRNENHNALPQNNYAISKLSGDLKVLESNSNSLVIRTNFFGSLNHNIPSFSEFIINSLVSRKKLYLFDDMFFTPIHIKTLLECIIKLLDNDKNGIYNITSSQRISKYDFGIRIADILDLDKSFISSSKLINRKDLVKRPFDLSLSNQKLKNVVHKVILTLDKQLELIKINYLQKP